MRTPDYPDTILDEDTSARLLGALRVGMIDMAYFPQIYFPRIGAELDYTAVSEDEVNRFRAIHAKITYDSGGQVPLTRSLKIRLLNAVRAGRINLHADFPELATAYRAVGSDCSAISPEEDEFILDICRRIST